MTDRTSGKISSRTHRLTAVIAVLALGQLALAVPAAAQTKVRFAYVKTLEVLPFFYAAKKGYFKDVGLDIEMIAVPGGPAVGAAIASGSADFGFAALSPVLIAREQGQPFKFFMSLEYEQTPGRLWGTIMASAKSGIKSIKDLAGKNIVLGVPGGLCELSIHDWMDKAGLAYSEARILNNPFPQMPAMLELGTADAACIVEPFATAALNGKTKPVELARGFLAEVTTPYRIAGLFAAETWIAAHQKEIVALEKASLRAATELNRDPSVTKAILADEFRFPAEYIEKLRYDFLVDFKPKAADYQTIIDKMLKYGMLKKPTKAEDVIVTAK